MYRIINILYLYSIGDMWISRKWLIVLISIMVMLPCFWLTSWQDVACDTYGNKSCKEVSNNYLEPYCVTNFNDDGDNFAVDYAKSCIWPVLTNNLSSMRDKNIALDDFSPRNMIEQYCSSLLWSSDVWRIYFARPNQNTDKWDWQQTFDSHQSLFVHALCASFTEWWKTPFLSSNATLWGVYQWNFVNKFRLQQMSQWWDLCSLDVNYWIMNCDISIYATKIFEGIMSDIFKIKYAQVLGVDDSEDFKPEKKVEEFMKWYYSVSKKYQEIETDYPKTVAILESDQQYYKSVLKNVKYLDNTKLATLAKDSKCPTDGNMVGEKFIACALHSSQWKGWSLTPSFVTLLYNEVLNYREFLVYYQRWLLARIERQSKHNLDETDLRILEAKYVDFESYLEKQMEAVKLVQRGLEGFNMTYPLHIWISMYTEKIEKFRNVGLSDVVTSFYSLSEKLQNVQLPN